MPQCRNASDILDLLASKPGPQLLPCHFYECSCCLMLRLCVLGSNTLSSASWGSGSRVMSSTPDTRTASLINDAPSTRLRQERWRNGSLGREALSFGVCVVVRNYVCPDFYEVPDIPDSQ